MYDRDRTYYPKTLPSKKQRWVVSTMDNVYFTRYKEVDSIKDGLFMFAPHLLVKFPSAKKNKILMLSSNDPPHFFSFFPTCALHSQIWECNKSSIPADQLLNQQDSVVFVLWQILSRRNSLVFSISYLFFYAHGRETVKPIWLTRL